MYNVRVTAYSVTNITYILRCYFTFRHLCGDLDVLKLTNAVFTFPNVPVIVFVGRGMYFCHYVL